MHLNHRVPIIGEQRMVKIEMLVSPDVAHAIATDNQAAAQRIRELTAVVCVLLRRLDLVGEGKRDMVNIGEAEINDVAELAKALGRRFDMQKQELVLVDQRVPLPPAEGAAE